MPVITDTIEEALAPIGDGIMLAVPREVAGVPMEATRALIRRGVKNLHLVALPTSSLQADLLIGAGCVGVLETSAVSLGEFGPAPRFTAAIMAATIRMKDATCPALHAAFQAAEKGVPFMPLRGIIGSDMLLHRPDWRLIDNPFGTDDPIVLLPALKPDVVLLHAPMADRAGNVWIGRQRELRHHGPCGGEDRGHGGEIRRRQPARRSRARGRNAARLLCGPDRGGGKRLLAARPAGPLCRRPQPSRRICPLRCHRRRLRALSRPARACAPRGMTRVP